jgi:hypothetical protein
VDSVPSPNQLLGVADLVQQLPVEDPVEVGQEAVIVGIQAPSAERRAGEYREVGVNRMPSAARLSMPGVPTTALPLQPRASWRC